MCDVSIVIFFHTGAEILFTANQKASFMQRVLFCLSGSLCVLSMLSSSNFMTRFGKMATFQNSQRDLSSLHP